VTSSKEAPESTGRSFETQTASAPQDEAGETDSKDVDPRNKSGDDEGGCQDCRSISVEMIGQCPGVARRSASLRNRRVQAR
jgi:hypothetical protein